MQIKPSLFNISKIKRRKHANKEYLQTKRENETNNESMNMIAEDSTLKENSPPPKFLWNALEAQKRKKGLKIEEMRNDKKENSKETA